MKRLLFAIPALIALAAPARADIVLDTTGLGGTGNNVTFSSVASSNLILGRLNGQNDEVVRFRDLSGNGAFTGAANGNDIKINNTSDLDITIFNSTNLTQLGVTREIFSLVGEGTVLFHVTALESDGTFKNFNFTDTLKNGQNGYDFTAINGEKIWDMDIVSTGVITQFEHYRIDVVPSVAAVPELSTWAMMLFGFLGIGGVTMLRRRNEPAFRLV